MGWIIGFFKIIFIFCFIIGSVIAIGYVFNKLVESGEISKNLGLVVVLAACVIMIPAADMAIIEIGITVIYAITARAFLQQYKGLGEEYRKLEKVHKDLEVCWACLYAYIIPAAMLSMSELRYAFPVEIKGFLWYLVAALLCCAFLPVVQIENIKQRIAKVLAQIDRFKFISHYEINEIVENLAGDSPSADELKQKKDEVIELVKYFEETGRITAVGGDDSDVMLYLETACFRNIKSEIETNCKDKDILNIGEMVRRLKETIKLSPELLEGLIYALLSVQRDYESYGVFCISKEGSRAIIDVLDCEYVTGRKNEREISEQFGLTEDALAEFIIAHDYGVSTGSDIEPEMEEGPASMHQEAEAVVENRTIDINTCNEKDFLEIPSVNIVAAKKLVDYRKKQNGFQNIDEFMQISQIKPHISDKVRAMLICGTYQNQDDMQVDVDKRNKRKIRFNGRLVEY